MNKTELNRTKKRFKNYRNSIDRIFNDSGL